MREAREAGAVSASAQRVGASRQLITLAVDRRANRNEGRLWLPLIGVKGIEVVAPDPASARVWIFGDGTLEPNELIDALASWGYESVVLQEQLAKAV